VFERSFNKLSDDGRWVFLTVSNWRSHVLELFLVVVLGERGVDAEKGAEECTRLSLISIDYLGDQACYWAPKLAKTFGRKKLEGDPDRLAIQDAIGTLQQFGPVADVGLKKLDLEGFVDRFTKWCFEQATKDPTTIERIEKLLENVALLWSPGWSMLAEYRIKYRHDIDRVEYALRRAVEEMPYSRNAWVQRAEYACKVNDEETYISSLVSAVECAPNDVELIREAALQLCKYIVAHKTDLPRARRGVYIASVRSHGERIWEDLDATGLSRLAWLFLLEENREKACLYATRGCEKEPENIHCVRILSSLGRDWLEI